jgi:serine/threonine-protein kinase RsbW
MEEKFERDIESLDGIFAFIGRATSTRAVPESVTLSIHLAVEEIFTNMVKYNTGHGGDISIRVMIDGTRLIVQLVDVDVDPFDPDAQEAVGIDKPLEDRKIGGLGLHLVRSMVDKVAYEYKDRRMKVTVIKNLER